MALAGQEVTTRPRARQRRHDPGDGAHAGARRPAARGRRGRGRRSTCPSGSRRGCAASAQAFQEYKQLKLLKKPIKGIYILLFLLMTLIIVFSVTWFGLYLARGITGARSSMLAEGTREVAAGNLNYKVTARADDEIGILVDSFNRMTQRPRVLAGPARGGLPRSPGQARRAGASGAATPRPCSRRWPPAWSRSTRPGASPPSTAPPSACSAWRRPPRSRPALRGRLRRARRTLELVALIQRMERLRERHARARGAPPRATASAVTLLASATALGGPTASYLGMVLVFDDLTELLKAQRLAAWREVAQRIAHEIKNPLTPIQLSAQRLRRRLAAAGAPTRSGCSRSAPRPSSRRWRG